MLISRLHPVKLHECLVGKVIEQRLLGSKTGIINNMTASNNSIERERRLIMCTFLDRWIKHEWEVHRGEWGHTETFSWQKEASMRGSAALMKKERWELHDYRPLIGNYLIFNRWKKSCKRDKKQINKGSLYTTLIFSRSGLLIFC